jgi:hypothetical protein
MAAYIRQKPPSWFWLVSTLFLAWQLIGCAAFYKDTIAGLDDPYQRQLFASMPGWFVVVFAAAVLAGTLGAAALLGRSKIARPLFLVSLIAVVVQYGYALASTDLIAHQGLAGAAGLPVTIAVLGAVQLWFAGVALRRGWVA